MSEEEAVVDRFQELRRDPRVIVGVVALVVLAAGVAWVRSSGGSSPPAASVDADAASVSTSSVPAFAFVHVVGAVRAPGLVQLPVGARVSDAVAAAGGAGADADLARVNLAARVADGQRIAVPRIGEPLPAGDEGVVSDDEPGGPINLNTATAKELEELPGIGPALAEAIVEERERTHGFRSVDDLQRVRGIGPARFAELRDLVTV